MCAHDWIKSLIGSFCNDAAETDLACVNCYACADGDADATCLALKCAALHCQSTQAARRQSSAILSYVPCSIAQVVVS